MTHRFSKKQLRETARQEKRDAKERAKAAKRVRPRATVHLTPTPKEAA
jgi:hypothetical protein